MFWLEHGRTNHPRAHHPAVVEEQVGTLKTEAAATAVVTSRAVTLATSESKQKGTAATSSQAQDTAVTSRLTETDQASVTSTEKLMPMMTLPQQLLEEEQYGIPAAQALEVQQEPEQQGQNQDLLIQSLREELEQERSRRQEAETQLAQRKKKEKEEATKCRSSRTPMTTPATSTAPTASSNVVVLSQKQYAALQTEMAGFRQLVDVLTIGKPAMRAAAAATSSSVPSLHPAVAMPLHVVRLLEYMPWHAKALRYAITAERVYEWQVYRHSSNHTNSNGGWHATLRYFPEFFAALPTRLPYGTMNQQQLQGSMRRQLQHRRNSKIMEEDEDPNPNAIPMFDDPSNVVVTNESLSYRFDLANGYPLPQDSVSPSSLKDHETKGSSTGTPTWKWLGKWHASSDTLHPFDDNGWSYAREAAHFLQVYDNINSASSNNNQTSTSEKKKKTRKRHKPVTPPPAPVVVHASPEPLLASSQPSSDCRMVRRRVWARRRILVDYPMASEATKHYLELLAEKEQATMKATALAAAVVEAEVAQEANKREEGRGEKHGQDIIEEATSAQAISNKKLSACSNQAHKEVLEEPMDNDGAERVAMLQDKEDTKDISAWSAQSEPRLKKQPAEGCHPAELVAVLEDSIGSSSAKNNETELNYKLVDRVAYSETAIEAAGSRLDLLEHHHSTRGDDESQNVGGNVRADDDDASCSRDSCSTSRFHDPVACGDTTSTSPPASPADPPKTIILDLRNLFANLVGNSNSKPQEKQQGKRIDGEAEESFRPMSLLGHKLTLDDEGDDKTVPPGVEVYPEDYSCCSSSARDDDESSILSTTPPPASAFLLKVPMMEPPAASSTRASFKASTIATVEEEELMDLSSHSTSTTTAAPVLGSADTAANTFHPMPGHNKWKLWGK